MDIVKRIPMRYVVSIFALAIWGGAAFIASRTTTDWGPTTITVEGQADNTDGVGWDLDTGMPLPPLASYIQATVAAPGCVAGLPIIILGIIFGYQWLVTCGIGFGTAFFWYSVGWYFDCANGSSERNRPPRLIRIQMEVLGALCVLALPLWVVAMFQLRQCWGHSPLWPELLKYGIVLTGVTVGAFLTLRRLWKPKQPAALNL